MKITFRPGRPSRFEIGNTGQAMLEYVLASGILLACVTVMAVLLWALREHADRILTLVASEYP